MLHNDIELFKQVVIATGDAFGINYAIIEKDYYVTEILKSIAEKEPKIIFKGGTSLSKCYGIIKRFSEDIDFGFECEHHTTEGERKRIKAAIVSTIEEFGFTLTNPESVRSRRDYNKYIVAYPFEFSATSLKPNLIVETSVFVRAYPSVKRAATSYIYDYLKQDRRDDIIEKYSLSPFEIKVQSLDRTFIDKIFAICDYYLDGRITEHSRHIYDLSKLYQNVTFDDNLKLLFKQVLRDRKAHPACLSAQDGVDIPRLLKEIVDGEVYKNDYESITAALLFEKVPYETAINNIKLIIDSKLVL